MAEDAVAMWLCDAEDNHESIPATSDKLNADHPQFVSLIEAEIIQSLIDIMDVADLFL